MQRASAYLIVNGISAWPITIRRLAKLYLAQIFEWPGCIVVEEIGPEWLETANGNYIRKEIDD